MHNIFSIILNLKIFTLFTAGFTFTLHILNCCSYCICLKTKTLCICQFSPSSSSHDLSGITRNSEQKIFYRPSNSQYNSVICCNKSNFSGLVLFWISHSKVEFPGEYLIHVATRLFAYH